MRAAPICSILVLALVAALGCPSRMTSQVSMAEDSDLGRYRTFALSDAQRPEPGTPAASYHDLAERLVSQRLIAQGLTPAADPARADLLVEVVIGRRAKARTSGSAGAAGQAAGLLVTMRDRAADREVFRGLAYETWYDSMDPEAEIRKAVDEIAQKVAARRR